MLFNRSKDQLFYQLMVDATANICEAVQLFRENVETLEEKEKYAERIKELESKGDEYTHLLIKELNQTFVTPLDHEDILKLATNLDDVLDGVEACAARFVYMHVDKSTPYLVKFAEILEECARQLQDSFIALEKRDYATIRKISIEINNLENEGDKLMRESVSTLFEEPVNPVELIKMKEIYERLEDVTDTFEDLMDLMESVVMKYA
ncbi:DUF47 domain-containing protein [Paenactinomyces guangxiensis]|uniref:DUF47 family protein n=1 Tax=Paenactinomyces guangxiensis TaxID=1490290 RepID=A0A7W1WMM9_9BACL|nr:DUF47 family protein [Paenactinomyces guangxiensis]MBA4492728.1 DUF47 family protein [Paenactinomyces guangxiensis]MBH8590423.1 DUF47 family protein [Paenactinomyces guangxiensis]